MAASQAAWSANHIPHHIVAGLDQCAGERITQGRQEAAQIALRQPFQVLLANRAMRGFVMMDELGHRHAWAPLQQHDHLHHCDSSSVGCGIMYQAPVSSRRNCNKRARVTGTPLT